MSTLAIGLPQRSRLTQFYELLAPLFEGLSPLFEGLFLRVLPPDQSFRDELRLAGYQPDEPADKQELSSRTFARCVDVAQRHFFADRSHEEARQELGRQLVIGVLQTRLCRVVGFLLPLLGPQLCLKALPASIQVRNTTVQITPVAEGPKRWLLSFRNDPNLCPDLMASSAMEVLRRTRAGDNAHVEVIRHAEPGSFDLKLSW
jgi:uncharacterized protein (TIGR02265 family)